MSPLVSSASSETEIVKGPVFDSENEVLIYGEGAHHSWGLRLHSIGRIAKNTRRRRGSNFGNKYCDLNVSTGRRAKNTPGVATYFYNEQVQALDHASRDGGTVHTT